MSVAEQNLDEYKRKVKCDGEIIILKEGKGIIKKKSIKQMTVDLKYMKADKLFVDNDNLVYTFDLQHTWGEERSIL